MAAGVERHVAMARGLAFIIKEIAAVQPVLDDDDLLDDIEEYAEFDGSELPLMDDWESIFAVREDGSSYIDVQVQGQTLRITCQEL